MSEGLARPLCHHGRLPRSVLGLLDILVIPTSARFTLEYRLSGVLQRPLGLLGLGRQVRAANMDDPVPRTLGVALCQSRIANVAAVVLCRARGGQLVGLPRGWRELAPRPPRAWWRLVRLLRCANRRVDPLCW